MLRGHVNLLFLSFLLIASSNTGCSKVWMMEPLNLNSIEENKEFRQAEKAFKEAESKDSISAYKEFINIFPNSPLTNVANDRIADYDMHMLSHLFYAKKYQEYRDFIIKYPDNIYIAEVHDFMKFLNKLTLGVISNSPEIQIAEILNWLKSLFGESIIVLNNFNNNDNSEISTFISVTNVKFNPNFDWRGIWNPLTGLIGGFIWKSLEYALNHNSTWGVLITNNNNREDFVYTIYNSFYWESDIFNSDILPLEIKKAVILDWILKSKKAPLGFIKAILSVEEFRDPDYCNKIIKALGSIENPPWDYLSILLNKDVAEFKESAIYALGETKDAKAINPLFTAVHDKRVQVETIEALGKIGKPALDKLIQIYGSETSSVRAKVIEVLGKINDPLVFDLLIGALSDNYQFVIVNSIKALGKLKNPEAINPLILVLTNETGLVKSEATKALEEITGMNFGGDAVKWQEWYDQNR
jgi:hypothetical protein